MLGGFLGVLSAASAGDVAAMDCESNTSVRRLPVLTAVQNESNCFHYIHIVKSFFADARAWADSDPFGASPPFRTWEEGRIELLLVACINGMSHGRHEP